MTSYIISTLDRLYDKEHSLAHTKAICTTLELGLLNGMDWPEKVLNFYERMAREHGTVQDVVDGRVALDGPLAIVAKRRATESAQYQVAAEQQQLKRTERRQQEKGKGGKDKGKVEKERPDLKKKLGEKRRREDAMDDSAKPKKVKQEGFAEAAKSDKNITQPPAKDVEMGEAATQDNAAPAEKKPATSYFKTDADKVPLTIFVSNLSPNVTESVLRETFTGCGGSIADIRMVHDTHSQREKHFAYVEFSHEGAVERALKKDREPIQAPGDDTPRNMFVSRFHFKGGAKTASTMNAAPVDKRVLFVSKLPDEVKREQLESLFAKV